MIGGDSLFGIVEKVTAKALLTQIEFDLKHATRLKQEVAKKLHKAGRIRRDDMKKASFGANVKQIQSLKIQSRVDSPSLIKTHEPKKSLVKERSLGKQSTSWQKNEEKNHLTKCLSSLEISENHNISFVKNEKKDNEKKTVKQITSKNGKTLESTELPEGMQSPRRYRRNEHLRENSNNDNRKRRGKKLAIESHKSIGKISAKAFKADGKKQMKEKEGSKQTLLHDCKPVSIIPPCPNISELGNLLDLKLGSTKTLRKVATKAKSSVELPFREMEELKKPQTAKEPSSKEVHSKVAVQPAVPVEPPLGRTSGREVPKKWRAGTRIETTASGVRRFPARLPRLAVPRPRPLTTGLPNLDVVCNKLCSSSSLVQLMLHFEDVHKSERYNPLGRCEQLVNKYKEELNKVLMYPENPIPEKNCKSPSCKNKTSSANKKIRISECADVRGFKELLAGTREYNWKTKSAVQHRPAESPWLNVLLPKEEGDSSNNKNQQNKTFIIPEVDPMNEIVEACVEKELKRCAGFANVKKAKCKDFTKEKVLLCYEKSAIEKYSPVIDTEQISDLLVKHGLPFILRSGENVGITLSATEMNHASRKKTLRYLPPPATPCTPMSDKLLKVTKHPKKKKSNRKRKDKRNKNKKKHDTRNRKMFRKKKFIEELQKQIDCAPPYIFDTDKSLTEINFEQEPQTYISFSESKNDSSNENEEETEFYITDYVVDKDKPNPSYSFRMTREDPKKFMIDVNQVLSAVGKAQDILLKMPLELLNCSNIIREVKEDIKECTSDPTIQRGLEGIMPEEINVIDKNDFISDETENLIAENNTNETIQEIEEGKLTINQIIEKPAEEAECEENTNFSGNEEKYHAYLVNISQEIADDNQEKTISENNIECIDSSDIFKDSLMCKNNEIVNDSGEIPDNDQFSVEVSEMEVVSVDSKEDLDPNDTTQTHPASEIHKGYSYNNHSTGCFCEGNKMIVSTDKNHIINRLENKNSKTNEMHSFFSLNFPWTQSFFVGPKSGKMIGFTRKENVQQNLSQSPLQLPVIYCQITNEALKSFSNIDFQNYTMPDLDICQIGKIQSIKDFFKSVSIKTIFRGRPK